MASRLLRAGVRVAGREGRDAIVKIGEMVVRWVVGVRCVGNTEILLSVRLEIQPWHSIREFFQQYINHRPRSSLLTPLDHLISKDPSELRLTPDISCSLIQGLVVTERG